MDCSPPGSSVHGFSRQEYWTGLPCPPPGDLPNPEMEPVSLMSPARAGGSCTTHATREAPVTLWWLSKSVLITWCGEINDAQIQKSKLTVILKITVSWPGLVWIIVPKPIRMHWITSTKIFLSKLSSSNTSVINLNLGVKHRERVKSEA